MASTSGSNNTNIDDSDYWQPLYLSTIAGLSTCIGAAVVFCQPQQQQHNDETTNGRPNPKKIRIVPPHTMAFSLALAGSVMVTVSVVSILPEVLMDDDYSDDGADGTDGTDGTSYKMIPIFSLDMFYRILFFALGSGLYFGLSKLLNVPEPEEVLDNVLLGGTSSGNSNHEHDYEHGQELIPLTTNIMNNKNDSFEQKDTNDNINNSSNSNSNSNNNGVPRSPLRERKNTKQTTATTSQIIGLPLLQSSPGDNNGKRKVGMSHCHPSSSSSKKDIEFPLPLSLPLSSASSSSVSASASASASSSSSSPPSLSFRSWTTGEDLGSNEKKKAWRVAVLLFVSLLVHNFPEGLAVAASALESTKLGTCNVMQFICRYEY
jgi:zinc transporter ZupT